MAIKLLDKPNVRPEDSDYIYGAIKDDDGSGGGTPVNTAVYGDFHQFFARILDKSGITPNGLPDNNYSGFQYYDALRLLFDPSIAAAAAAAAAAQSTANAALSASKLLKMSNYVANANPNGSVAIVNTLTPSASQGSAKMTFTANFFAQRQGSGTSDTIGVYLKQNGSTIKGQATITLPAYNTGSSGIWITLVHVGAYAATDVITLEMQADGTGTAITNVAYSTLVAEAFDMT